jgi:dienelactone hydrolase
MSESKIMARRGMWTPGPPPPDLLPYFTPQSEWTGGSGSYPPPLVFEDGTPVRTSEEWRQRREEILRFWHGQMGAWPPLLETPGIQMLEQVTEEQFNRRTVRVETAPGRDTVGYLLVPHGPGPFPAALAVFYEAETAIGEGKENLDFARQLARRGFVALSLGCDPGPTYPTERDVQLQPLSFQAYMAANCHRALAQLDEVDSDRIGVLGHSYGGKWAMFAACLYEPFACGAWSDPGIVFDETRSNVNYWEPWYLGWEAGVKRQPGIPAETNPRTGAYRRLIETGHDLHEIHALMAPRPFLVSGGSEDPPERWRALNSTMSVNRLLGCENRVAMTNRPGHTPTSESNEILYRFFEWALQPRP